MRTAERPRDIRRLTVAGATLALLTAGAVAAWRADASEASVTVPSNFKPPAGGVMRIEGRIQMPDPTGAAAAGYWPAFWAWARPTGATTRTGRASASST